MEAKLIDLSEWEQFGGGGNGWSYNHKTDDGIILKLNKEDLPKEKTEREYLQSKRLYEIGVNCPEVFDFVTDGTRYGYTVQKITGKQSYARMISVDPSRLEELAISFATMSREIHSTKCDTEHFPSYQENLRAAISSCPVFSNDVKDMLIGYIDSLDNTDFCVHGDFNPGNIIRAQDGKDYWIDLGDFAYGDPDYDIAILCFLSTITPAKVVEYLFHISRKQMSEFLEIYGREYYGEQWHTPQLDEKIRRICLIKAAEQITKRQKSKLLFLPYIKGQKIRLAIIMWLTDHLVNKFN